MSSKRLSDFLLGLACLQRLVDEGLGEVCLRVDQVCLEVDAHFAGK